MILVNFFCFSALLATFLTFASAAPRDTIAAHLGALLPRQAPPPVGAGNFRNCGGGLDLIVKNALRDAQTLSQAAVNYSPTDPYFTAWFGASSQKEINQIKKRYGRISNWLNAPDKDLIFNCDTQTSVCAGKSTVVAWTTKFGGEINLCSNWFLNPGKSILRLTPPSPHRQSVSLDAYVTQGVQLLHEMTHALWGTDDQTINTPTGTESAYSHKNTLILAQQNPSLAKMNADNYAFFAMAAFWNRGRWSTDPNNLTPGGGDL